MQAGELEAGSTVGRKRLAGDHSLESQSRKRRMGSRTNVDDGLPDEYDVRALDNDLPGGFDDQSLNNNPPDEPDGQGLAIHLRAPDRSVLVTEINNHVIEDRWAGYKGEAGDDKGEAWDEEDEAGDDEYEAVRR
jgi:hypothetical protein